MSRPVRVLIIDDSSNDAEPLAHELEREGYDVTWRRVGTAESIKSVLREREWNTIISTCSMPRLSTEEPLERERERFEALMEMGLDVVAILDRDGTLRYVSPSARTVLGYDPAELIGTNALDLVYSEDRPDAAATLERVAASAGAISRSDLRARHRDGSVRCLEVVGANLVDRPAIGGILINLRDVTERKQVEQLKSDFLASISHELRTPLTVIIGYAALLEKKAGAAESQFYLDAAQSIRDRAEQMRWLIEDILELTQANADSFLRAPETVDAVALVRRCVERTIQTDGHEVSVEPTDVVVPVDCDPDRLSRAVTHLLSNAAKFSPEGGRIRVTIEKNADCVRIAVSDEGVGIAPEDLPHVFNRFTQADMSSTRKFGGLGVGLYVSRQIVKAHGGRIDVESEPGKGSTFTINIPTGRREKSFISRRPRKRSRPPKALRQRQASTEA